MRTEKELGEALKREDDTITIEGDLVNKVIKIHGTGKTAWGLTIGAIGVAVVSVLATVATAGTSTPATGSAALISGGAAATVLGVPTAVSAVSIAVAAGGVGALNKLRDYNLTKINDNKVILKRKK